MSIRFEREEIRTDALGQYRAYIYPDGHTETSPLGRPVSREDLQRRRLRQAVNARPRKMADAQRTIRGDRTPSAQRDVRSVPSVRALMPSYHDTVNATAVLGATARTPRGLRQQLVTEFDLGGPVRDNAAGREYGQVNLVQTLEMPRDSKPVMYDPEHR